MGKRIHPAIIEDRSNNKREGTHIKIYWQSIRYADEIAVQLFLGARSFRALSLLLLEFLFNPHTKKW